VEVTDALIDKLANLARLEFSAVEKQAYKHDLERMIGFVDKLNELQLDNVPPLLHISSNENQMREDEIQTSITQEEALKNAPLHDEEFFLVPRVIRNPVQ
jgi:aspartyl-tRNA(Asn)/glutamyl-tRNA(Gln) amidotransferase subunit C